jgi:hypothetical protein
VLANVQLLRTVLVKILYLNLVDQKKIFWGWIWWYMPVTLGTWKEDGGFEASPR